MADLNRPRHRSDTFVTREVDGDLLVLDQENGKVHQLNSTACFVWKACSGERTIDEIASQMQANFEDVEAGTIKGDLRKILEDLEALQLIDYPDLQP